MNAFILVPVSIVAVAALSLLIYLKAPHWLKRTYGVIVTFVAVVAACLLFSSIGYQRGYNTALSHRTAPLVRILDALDQIHAGNVDGATRNFEEACFRLANDLLEDERYRSDLGGIKIRRSILR